MTTATKELEVFEFKNQQVRLQVIEGAPWFIRNDVCRALGLTNPTMATANFDEDDLSTTEGIDSMGRKTKVVLVSEPGLYQLIFQSRKPEARTFKRWVTHEVLPAIRKTGRYTVNGQEDELHSFDSTPAPFTPALEAPAVTAQKVIQEKLKTLQMAHGLVDSLQLQARAWLLIDGIEKTTRKHKTGDPLPVSEFVEEYFNPSPEEAGRVLSRFSKELKRQYEQFYGEAPARKHGHYRYTAEDKPLMIQVAQTIINH